MPVKHPRLFTIPLQAWQSDLAQNTAYYFSSLPTALVTTSSDRRIYLGEACTIVGCHVTFKVGVHATTESCSVVITRSGSTSVTVSNTLNFDADYLAAHNDSLSLVCSASDFITIKLTTPATYVTPPQGVLTGGYIVVSVP